MPVVRILAVTGAPVVTDEGFRETDFGAWEGLTFAEVRERWPAEMTAWLADPAVAPPGGESFTEVSERVTPALHSPLMSVTNAISSVIIVGALIAAGPLGISLAKIMGFVAVTLAAVNIFGGFIVTQRMLQMFQRKR